MGAPKQYKSAEVMEAIDGSGGIMSTVASRLKCDWHTAKKYTEKWEMTKIALANEKELVLDLCEGVLLRSIRGGDTSDAKWYLSTKGRSRGFGARTTLDLEVDDVKITEIEVDVDPNEEDRLSKIREENPGLE